MSSNTQIHVRRVRHVTTVYDVTEQDVVPVDSVLGPGGAKLLLQTLEALPTIRKGLSPEAAALLDWEPAQEAIGCFQTTVNGAHVTLRLGENVAEVLHTREVTLEGAGARPSPLDPGLQRAVNRKVNQLLVVAMGQRIAQRLQQKASGMRVQQTIQQRTRQTVQQSAGQTLGLRLQAYAPRR